jgi:hypothetical protein
VPYESLLELWLVCAGPEKLFGSVITCECIDELPSSLERATEMQSHARGLFDFEDLPELFHSSGPIPLLSQLGGFAQSGQNKWELVGAPRIEPGGTQRLAREERGWKRLDQR